MARKRVRKRLTKTPEQEAIEEANALIGKMPRFLDRKRWTNNERRRNQRAWDKIMREERQKRAHERAKTDAEIFRKARRARHHKVMKQFLREERRAAKDERKARGIRRRRIAREHNDAVRECLQDGLETTSQIAKKLELETKMVRRALKRLMDRGEVHKVSAKVYSLGRKRKRKRLSQ